MAPDRSRAADDEFAFAAAAEGAAGMRNPRYGTRGGWPYAGASLPDDTRAFAKFSADQGEQMPLLAGTSRMNEQTALRTGEP